MARNDSQPTGQKHGYEDDGRAELEFMDTEGVIHIIYVDPKFIVKSGQ
jgi:hypothetical protein